MDAQIRLATEADAEKMLEIYSPVVRDTVISFEEEAPSIDDFRRRIRSVLQIMPWLVCQIGNDVAGYAYSTPFRTRAGYRWTAELTVYVHPAYHRRGVGRALYSSLLRCLALQGYRTAIAIIALPNPASEGLHEAMGFRRTGVLENIGYKHGRWVHDAVWQMDIQSPYPAMVEPVPMEEFVGTAQWTEAMKSGEALVD